jgi:O-antigen/teichoic acid export membrane protein
LKQFHFFKAVNFQISILVDRIHVLLKKNKIINRIFFSSTSERTKKTRKNILYSTAYRGLGMLLGLWMVPLTLGYLDANKYGIWLTLTSLITWLNFFDIGLGNGLRNKLGEALAKKDNLLAKGYVSTTYAIITLIVSGIFILFLLLSHLVNWNNVLNVPPSFNENLSSLVLIVTLFFCFRFVFGLILIVLNADQKLAGSGFIDLFINTVSLLSVYAINQMIPQSLIVLGSTLSAIPAVVVMVAGVWLFNTTYKDIKPSFRFIKFDLVKDMAVISSQFFILQALVLLIFFSNNIIIAQLLNPSKVTEFNIVYKYFNIVTTISLLILNPFWSAATEAFVKKDFEWLKSSSKQLITLWLLISVLAVAMVIISPVFYFVWLKGAIEIPFLTSVIMGIYVILLSWHNSFVYLINGIGKIRLQLYTYIVMGIMVLPMSYFFIKVLGLGIVGSVLSMIVCLIPPSILMPIQLNRIINNKAEGVFNK